ncbi:hypothetical protein [Sphingomonas sanxanigenens]|uniref:Uncharacterized protein n=1 Tax=Sphingomonas sanxanigenens DSM 19645 = NX02 TaxID=1123269 RepID=W0AHQ3_9SPHN|nr:hypothetical protein [Sphingomonas sanxanigenens]AHE57434.1 hypothetical protein NX02_29350 [Sphingomonas sanxanigenens DSM 19645 = NX02]
MIDLPTDVSPLATPRYLDFGGFLEPPTGAEVQRLNRLGNRFAVAFKLPPLGSDREGRVWVSRLLRGIGEGARIPYPLVDYQPGTPGEVVVNGNGQAGRLLNVRGATPRYAFKEGAPFSIEMAGQHFLHFVDDQVIADAAGNAQIQFSPMLRKQPADGDKVHVARPMIEGFVMGSELAWNIALDRNISIEFEIHERR